MAMMTILERAPTMSLRKSALLSTSSLVLMALAPQQAFAATAAESAAADQPVPGEDQIAVTASGYAQNIKDAPASITVITAEEIRQRSYTDITDVMQNVPGVHIQGGGVEQSIMIRGMGADYTLFLVDGRPQQDNQAFGLNGTQAGTPINFLPPLDSIERIEVIRGPASSLYGSDAIGGVVNIITKRVMNDFGGSVTSEYIMAGPDNDVTNDSLQTSLALNVPVIKDRLSLQLNGAIRMQDEADFVGGGDSAAADPRFRRRNLAAKLGFRLDDSNTFTLGGGHTIQQRWHNPGRSLAETDTASFSETLRDNFFFTHEGRYGQLQWDSYVNYDTSENPTRINATTGAGISFDTLAANSQATLKLSRHTIVGGINYRKESLKDGATNGLNLPGIVIPTDIVTMERHQYAAFLEENWRVLDDLSLVLSGRYDYSENFGGRFSPKVYANYAITDNLTIKGGLTSGYKVPSLRSAATDFGSTSMGGVIIGNPDLKPEKTLNYEAGIVYSNRNAGISTGVTVYRSEFEDKLLRTGRVCLQNVECVYGGVTYPAHQFGYTTYENVDTARLQGVEWTLDWKIVDGLTYRHSYTFSETEQTSGTNAGKPLNDIPEHMFNASVTWQVNDALNIWTQANYRGRTSGRTTNASGSGTNDLTYPPYAFFNLGGVYEFKKDMRFNLGIYNMFNKQVTPEDGFAYVLDGRRISAALSINF